jgi:transcriptional regulator with XRE-family HTH domain
MIVNERHYQVTCEQLERFEAAYEQGRHLGPLPHLDPRIQAAMVEDLKYEVQRLRRRIRRHEGIKAGTVTTRKVKSFADLPKVLIEARIARNMTQKQLAEKLGMVEQQIQRYEQQDYEKTSLDRLVKIADALGVRLDGEARFGKPTKRRTRAVASSAKAKATSSPKAASVRKRSM